MGTNKANFFTKEEHHGYSLSKTRKLVVDKNGLVPTFQLF
jgi:hypothetical protein